LIHFYKRFQIDFVLNMTQGSESDSQDDANLLRVLISSDIHLGYAEKDQERGNDSFNSFDELLGIGVEQNVDMVILGGDLFHENKPSRRAEIKCIEILRNHVLGDRPVQIEYLSDPLVDYAHCNSKIVNYESSNLNIGLPIFSIHGNHDDPSGLGAHSCLDLIHEAGLINYFGKVTDLKYIKVRPVLLRKGNVKVAMYGLSHVKDERLHRLFRENKVCFETPSEDPESWFNILVLHQNRAKRGPTNYIPDSFLPSFFHIVVWGHEHDCRIVPEGPDSDQPFFITQPGSPCATSLCEAESLQKHVGILNIRADNKFKMDPIALQSVRPLIFKTLTVTDLKSVNLAEEDLKKLTNSIETALQYEVEDMIAEADSKLTGHRLQGQKPLLRLRVEYTDESQQLSSARFGNMFIDRVCNASDILLFKRRAAERKVKSDNFDAGAMGDLFDENVITMEDLVDEYFKNQTDEKHKLSVLNVKDIGNSVKIFIDKDDKDALKYSIEKAIDKSFASLMAREDGLEELDDMLIEEADDDDVKPPAARGIAAKNQRNHVMSDSDDDMEDIDEPVATSTQRGRGRGRGVRGGRGRAAASAPSRGTSPAKRGRGRAASSSGSTQSTLAQSFAKAGRQTQTNTSTRAVSQRNKKQMFESDSDDFD